MLGKDTDPEKNVDPENTAGPIFVNVLEPDTVQLPVTDPLPSKLILPVTVRLPVTWLLPSVFE